MREKVNFISDKRILSWNDRLSKTPYSVSPIYSSKTGLPEITIFQKVDEYMSTLTMTSSSRREQTLDPSINYKFSFSVSSNRVDQFFEILESILKIPFGTNYLFNDKTYKIELDNSIVLNRKEETHNLLKKEYKRFTYEFSGRITHIMCYISCIEDTICYFEKIWGYDERGKEYCLLKYPIGSIVSTKDDKSKDYLVLDYSYEKDTNDNYNINYYCSEMLNTKSHIIQYGDTNLYYEDFLCFSRNNRIDGILN